MATQDCTLLLCSEKDFALMKEMFLKYDALTVILEEDHGFKLVLHQRDFLAGRAILTNMAEMVTTSRRMIMLLSK